MCALLLFLVKIYLGTSPSGINELILSNNYFAYAFVNYATNKVLYGGKRAITDNLHGLRKKSFSERLIFSFDILFQADEPSETARHHHKVIASSALSDRSCGTARIIIKNKETAGVPMPFLILILNDTRKERHTENFYFVN